MVSGSGIYELAKEGKILAVKTEFGINNKVIICLPYNQELIRKVKTIPRRRWNQKGKYGEVPYGENLIPKLQTLFGESFVADTYFYLISLQRELSIRKYSRRTIKSYKQKKVATSTLNIVINALRFFYGEVLNKGMYMHNTADIIPKKLEHIRSADMNELSEMADAKRRDEKWHL